jgi:hypothetical protein
LEKETIVSVVQANIEIKGLSNSPLKEIGCCNPKLGLVAKERACKGAGQKRSPKVTFHAPGG